MGGSLLVLFVVIALCVVLVSVVQVLQSFELTVSIVVFCVTAVAFLIGMLAKSGGDN